jgi:hypothetical protein
MTLKRKIIRLALLLLALGVTIFLCHASKRLVRASENYSCFGSDQGKASFSDLLRFSVYLYLPSCDACLKKLRQIDGAKQEWALEKNKTSDDTPTWKDLAPYFGRGTAPPDFHPRCPDGGLYIIGKVGESPRCTIREHPRLL